MANRTYVPEMASRLAMADPDARAAPAEVTTPGQANGEAPDSDDESLQSPGRHHSHFILHNQLVVTPEREPVQALNGAHGDPMELDHENSSHLTLSDTSTEIDFDDSDPFIDPVRVTVQSAPVVPPRTTPDSAMDTTGAPPPESGSRGVHFTLAADDTVFQQPVDSYHELHLQTIRNSATSSSQFPDIANDPALSHLREISGLASWTVSSFKPSCGVAALLNPSTATFWQSDGPQPHLLNIHFFKLVRIVKLRIYLDFELDESYTPTRLAFAAGTHEYDAVEFAEWRWDGLGPKGWVDVDLSQCGSDEEREREMIEDDEEEDEESSSIAGVLRCFFLQVRVLENHQNGKDTHIRGVQIFARDERVKATRRIIDDAGDEKVEQVRQGLEEADWMREPELR